MDTDTLDYKYGNLPDYVERKGSLFMRSDHMNYSRATLNSNWHQAREAEPKDYDLNRAPVRDLCIATYNRIGDNTDGSLPISTYQAFGEDVVKLKRDFTEQEPKKYMVNEDTACHVGLDRETGAVQRGYGAVLPRHQPAYNKFYFETTNMTDFKPPFPYAAVEEKPAEVADHSTAYKRCQSQFTDAADYRRHGRNTWYDESGIYTNSHLKPLAPPYKKTCPIAERLA